MDLIANTSFWEGEKLPDKIGTVKFRQSVTLPVREEHLLREKLPNKTSMSQGSMPTVEPTSSKSMHINIIVGSVITPLWDDRWIPMKITNLSDRAGTVNWLLLNLN